MASLASHQDCNESGVNSQHDRWERYLHLIPTEIDQDPRNSGQVIGGVAIALVRAQHQSTVVYA
jgi:hypothetical protein